MFGAYKERREEHGVQLYGSLGIDRNDAAGRLAQYKKNFEFFDAPVALFITIDRRLGPGQWADLGGYIHALAFLARGHGLDTCPQEAWARLYDTVGDFLKLPPNEMLFCGMAIGYGDRKHKANDFRSPRAELVRILQILWLRLGRRTRRNRRFHRVVSASSRNSVATPSARRCHAAKQHNEANMPFLFWMPMIVMRGLWRAAEDDTRDFPTHGSKKQTPASAGVCFTPSAATRSICTAGSRGCRPAA